MKLYTITKAAELLNVHRSTLYNWERAGLIKFVQFGKCQRVPESEIERMIKGE